MRAGRLALLTFAALLCLGVERPPGLSDVAELRHWSYPDYTRVVVELTDEVRIKRNARLLPPADGRPERLYMDLEGVWVGRDYENARPVGDGLLEGIRIGQNTKTAIRVVLDLETHARHRVLLLSHPDRLVIDVYGRRGKGDASLRDEGLRLPTDLRQVRTIVLDAGHGGRDPGAIGIGGLREKDVTLKLARALQPKLEERGFRVVNTRDSDKALSLEERTAIAEGAGGDLFVSLHANASRRRSANGIETYYLDQNYERHSVTVAARENGVPRSEVNDLQRTLARLRVSEVSPHSKRLAEHVQNELITGLPKQYRPVEDLGVKKGPFYVLFLSGMPAVLVESGFVTHRGESKRLRDPGYIDAVAEGIADALVEYRDDTAALAVRSSW
ncbi:MAG: N-acetylmuramoyl-L-alanine amidase [Myxococcota bacterium]